MMKNLLNLILIISCIGLVQCKCRETSEYLEKILKTRKIQNALADKQELTLEDLDAAYNEIKSWDVLTSVQVRNCDEVLHLVEELVGLHKELLKRDAAVGGAANLQKLYEIFLPYANSDKFVGGELERLETTLRTNDAFVPSLESIKKAYYNYEELIQEFIRTENSAANAERLKSIMHLIFDMPILHDVVFPAVMEAEATAKALYKRELERKGYKAGRGKTNFLYDEYILKLKQYS